MHGNMHLVLIMCHLWDKILSRLLPSFISAWEPSGVPQLLKIALTLILRDTILTISPGYSSSSKGPQPSHFLYNYFFQHPLELYLKHFIKENAMQNMKNAGIEKISYGMFSFFRWKGYPFLDLPF